MSDLSGDDLTFDDLLALVKEARRETAENARRLDEHLKVCPAAKGDRTEVAG
jgi:hypothetical protein